MMDDSRFGSWVEHDGKGVPAAIEGEFIFVEFRCGDRWLGIYGVTPVATVGGVQGRYAREGGPSSWHWGTSKREWEVLRYCIGWPRALLDLIDMVNSLPVSQPEQVAA